MALTRISIAEDKAALVKALRASENNEAGFFTTRGDILTFAAVLGFKHKRRVQIEKTSRDFDPVLQEQFRDSFIISLIAFLEADNPKVLAFDDESDRLRVQIFQEYANGGLEILQNKLRGSTDYLSTFLLLIESEKSGSDLSEEFDLTKFL